MDPYQSVIIISEIPQAQIVIVKLIQNVRAPQIAHQTQTPISDKNEFVPEDTW